jgi:hypothetical protein
MKIIEYSKLTTDNNQFLTQSLFYECRHQSMSDYIPFTLRENDFKDYISVYKIFMESDSEYECAKKLLNSWKHWCILKEAPFFKKEYLLWVEEKAIRDAAVGIKTLVEAAKDGNIVAAKYLVDKQNSAKSRKVGRPTRAEVIEEKRKEARLNNKVSNIIDRMSKYQK